MFGRFLLWSCPFLNVFCCDFFIIIITNLNSLLVTDLFKLLFFLHWFLADHLFVEICAFLLGCPFCWHITVQSILLWYLVSLQCFVVVVVCLFVGFFFFFLPFIQFMRFSRQVYWGGLSFPPSVDHVLSELSAMTHPSWMALHSMAHSFIELCKPLHHDKAVIHEVDH